MKKKNRISAFALITVVTLMLLGLSCTELEQRFWGYSLEITSPESEITFRQDEAPSVPVHMKISGWTEERLQATGAYIFLQVDGVTVVEITAYGDKPTAAVPLATPGKHIIKAVLPIAEGGELVDEVSVSWLKPSPLDKVAGAVTGLVVSGGTDPTTGYLFLFLIGELALALIGSSIGGGLGAKFFMLIGVAIAVVTLAQTPEGQSALWVILLGVLGYFFLRLMFNFRFFSWREDSGMALGFTEDIAPAAAQIAQRHVPQLPAPSARASLPNRTPDWVRFLRGGGDDG